MNSHPREVVEQGFEQDRQDYWSMRDELLAKYAGKWVAVHKGRVVAVGDDPLSIMGQALGEDGYAYTNKVGEEDKIVIRQRRVSFPYDETYSPTAIPRDLGCEYFGIEELKNYNSIPFCQLGRKGPV